MILIVTCFGFARVTRSNLLGKEGNDLNFLKFCTAITLATALLSLGACAQKRQHTAPPPATIGMSK